MNMNNKLNNKTLDKVNGGISKDNIGVTTAAKYGNSFEEEINKYKNELKNLDKNSERAKFLNTQISILEKEMSLSKSNFDEKTCK